MSLIKNYFKERPVCKVTFKLDKNMVKTAQNVYLAGDFNRWDIESIPMKRDKSGDFAVTIELEKGKEYQFKYHIDNKRWLNDFDADRYTINEFQGENSVIIV